MELYVGLKVTVLGSFPSVGVYFGLYQFTKRQMDAIEGMSPQLSIVVSAGVGNFVARYASYMLYKGGFAVAGWRPPWLRACP